MTAVPLVGEAVAPFPVELAEPGAVSVATRELARDFLGAVVGDPQRVLTPAAPAAAGAPTHKLSTNASARGRANSFLVLIATSFRWETLALVLVSFNP